MRKIPTLFKREFENHHVVRITEAVTEGCECVLNGDCIPTIKWDGACCAIIGGSLYKRYDAKKGKPIPEGAIKCQENADPITGHLPCWVKCNWENPADRWFVEAHHNRPVPLKDGTYEAIGKHFNGNPYHLEIDKLIRHGVDVIRHNGELFTFGGIKQYLSEHEIEGIVFLKDGKPVCKIKRSDFGFEWNNRK